MKNSKQFRGTGVAMVTPFRKDGTIDFDAFGKLIDHLVKGKVEYLVPLGTTGESATLTHDEKNAVFNFVSEKAGKKTPIVAGIGGNNTREVLQTIAATDFTNIRAILSVTPYYNRPSQRGLYQHFKMIAGESPVPVIVYNVPGRTSCNMTAETTLALAHDIENIVGVKEASGNLEQILQIIRNKPEGFLVISGDDGITLPLMAMGADGVISVVANAYPKLFSDMVRLCARDDYRKARQIQFALSELIPALFAEGSPPGVKHVLQVLNICSEHLRLPLVPVSKTHQNKLATLVSRLRNTN